MKIQGVNLTSGRIHQILRDLFTQLWILDFTEHNLKGHKLDQDQDFKDQDQEDLNQEEEDCWQSDQRVSYIRKLK